jgi:hypothetical protein
MESPWSRPRRCTTTLGARRPALPIDFYRKILITVLTQIKFRFDWLSKQSAHPHMTEHHWEDGTEEALRRSRPTTLAVRSTHNGT